MSFATVVIGTGVLFFIATCWAILDIAQKDFGGTEKKAIWGFLALIPFVGPIIYVCFGYRKGTKPR